MEMSLGNMDSDRLRPTSLDDKSAHEWRQLAAQVLSSRSEPVCSRTNVTLEAAAEREPQSPATPAYRLWLADNLVRDGQWSAALQAYDAAVQCAQSAKRLSPTIDPIVGALYHKAQAAALMGEAATAIVDYENLSKHEPANVDPLFQAGLLAERQGQSDRAAEYYRGAARGAPSNRTDDPAELARRALLRLQIAASQFAASAEAVMDRITTALERRDASALQHAVSSTHFAVGPLGGHTVFEQHELLSELYRDLGASQIAVRRKLLGCGGKRYLFTSGWKGKWFNGDVVFLISQAPRGWECTGLAVAHANDLWIERWRPAVKQKNQPLPFELLAPWPAGQSFKAGGLTQYVAEQAAVLAGGVFGGGLLALYFARSPCGFGPRGFYYNQGSTHDEEDAFAIDFTRYRQYVPYDNESGGTPVLAARSGIVQSVRAGTPSGDSNASNTVEIIHADPSNLSDTSRFRSRYLHLEGPFKIPVSTMMPIFVGNRLGRMDDTGNSVLDHLHFSIHDRQISHPNVSYGGSVRPTTLSGVRLEDGDSGTCVRSTNIEYAGEKPMIEATQFAGQNWLITPAANAVNQAPPANIHQQAWLLVLTGVVFVDLKGNSGAAWRHETVAIRPDLNGPLQFAIGKFGIPTPSGSSGANYWTGFRVEQWAPFAALSSVFNEHESVNSGFAVDAWRPNPFGAAQD
ncbi:MAG TPA: peptidoglycan DD-metalloendopeptidase family protein, partial [Lacipirellulaceae bacterium]|nr:peptidoglycan DD-metalloendopeptidase family protein [Lacipirellulaceae bacterium]